MDAKSNDAATRELGELASVLVYAVATDKDGVLVLARRDGGCVQVHVSANEEQLGRLVGKGGDTARALRRVMAVVASRHGVRCDLNIGPFATAGKAGE